MKVLLDGQDITASLNAQFSLPSASQEGVFPNRSRSDWYDLLPAISANETLRNEFFNDNNGIHLLRFEEEGRTFEVKVLLRMKYSSRNR